MIYVSSSGTLKTGRRQEYAVFSPNITKSLHWGGMKYSKKSGHQVSKKKSVLNIAQIAVFHIFHCGPVGIQPFLF